MTNALAKFAMPHSSGREVLSWAVAVVIVVGGYLTAGYLTQLRDRADSVTARFDRAVAGSQTGWWEWSAPTAEPNNSANAKVWYSPQFAELLGYAPSEVEFTRRWFRDKLHPDDAEENQRRIAASLDNGTVYSMQLRLRTKSGDYRWFSAKGVPYYDEAGTAIYMSGSMQDVNATKIESLRLERLVGAAPVAIILCNERQLITEYNREAEQLFGWTRQEMVGRSVDRLVSLGELLHHSIAMGARVEELRHSDENLPVTKRVVGKARRKNGEEFTAEISLRSYKYGSVIEFAAVIKDKSLVVGAGAGNDKH